MTNERIIQILCREMSNYGEGWRIDWSDFDGRTLRDRLNELVEWGVVALSSDPETYYPDYTGGTEFYDRQKEWLS